MKGGGMKHRQEAGGLKQHHGGKAAVAAAVWSLTVGTAASGCCCCYVQLLQPWHFVLLDKGVTSSQTLSAAAQTLHIIDECMNERFGEQRNERKD